MKIFIDNQEADIDARTSVSISLSIASHTDLTTSRTGYSKTIMLPMTAHNMGIMGDSEQINAVSAFNKTEHTAHIEQDGCTVIEGTPFLAESVSYGAGGYYRINIIGPGKRWAILAAQTPLRLLGLEFSETLGAANILKSWTWDKPVRFLPVQRDGFEPDNFNNSLFPPQKILTIEDYHPFLHVGSMVGKIFADAGYAVSSEFFAGPFFDSLYMSGNYPAQDTDRIKARMDFRAGRFEAAEAVSDSLGRVYANPYSTLSSIGNIVDTANPNEERNGKTLNGVYSVGDYFRMNGSHVEFAPPTEVTVGFEYSLCYTAGCKIESRTTLRGFKTIDLAESQEREFQLLNPHVDRRNDIRVNKTYTAIIFEHAAATSYQIRYWEITNPKADPKNLTASDYTIKTATVFSVKTFSFSFPGTNPILNPSLVYRKNSTYIDYPGDWALYDGYVDVVGTMDVELVVRTTPEKILPSNPKRFDLISFGGADPGMSFKLSNRTTLKPYFVYHPDEGTPLDFENVAAHDISCLDLINGLKQMFNLYFFTDQLGRTVYVEPRAGFYRTGTVVDLSGRVDLSRPVVVSEPGEDMAQTVAFQYAAGDDAVSTWNRRNSTRLGRWSAEIRNRFASATERTYENPVFAPSVSSKGGFPNAASALLLQAAVKDAATGEKSDELNFPPKIVRYLGMTPLPTGQLWGWPGNDAKYPLLAFHYKGDSNHYEGAQPNPLSTFGGDRATLLANGFSLCFEDRDGVAGIHRYYDGNVSLLNEGKRVEVYVMLYPEDIEPLISPDSRGRDFRALYRLTVAGESTLLRLEQVCDYNPGTGGPTKCVFVKEV